MARDGCFEEQGGRTGLGSGQSSYFHDCYGGEDGQKKSVVADSELKASVRYLIRYKVPYIM